MPYILKHYDTALMTFDLQRDFDGFRAAVLRIEPGARRKLPLDLLNPDGDGLLHWLKNRTVPQNRAYVQSFLARLGLNERDLKGIIDICKGLSLNDSYWIVDEQFTGSFAQHNLYQNPFSRTMALMAFTGYGSSPRSAFHSSPEFTTGGMLAKCWRRIDGQITLYKSGTEGASNTGNEPYSEFYASQVALAAGLNAVPYGLSRWEKRLCSTCRLFTDIDHSYIPAGRLVREGGLRAVMSYCAQLGEEYRQQLADMLVFDALVCNTDRHFGNFGFIVDNKTNQICAPAPIFDNGFSLFNYALDSDLADIDEYARLRAPSTYPDFVQLARQVLGPRQREKFRRLISFKFQRHPRYNLPQKRLKTIEQFLQRRLREILQGE